VFRGKFVTGEKLEEYRSYCHLQGAFLGAAAFSLGLAVTTGSNVAAAGALVFSGLTIAHAYVNDGNFEKIEDAIEQAGGEASQ